MKAIYCWSEDGEMELVDTKKIVVDEDFRCYHCDMMIPVGSEVVQLTAQDGDVYVIRAKCAERSVNSIVAKF